MIVSSVMPDCRGVEESRIYSKRAKKVPLRDLSFNVASQDDTSTAALRIAGEATSRPSTKTCRGV